MYGNSLKKTFHDNAKADLNGKNIVGGFLQTFNYVQHSQIVVGFLQNTNRQADNCCPSF